MRKWFGRPSEGPLTTTWFWPVACVLGTIIVTLLLMDYRPAPDSVWARRLWPGNRDGASAMLQVVATSIMTAATITSSLTVVALQLASQQYSPRLLREFARDKVMQGVLGLLVSTFAAALMGLRAITDERPLPVALVFLVLLMGFASACALLFFVGHVVKSLRIESMMAATHREAVPVIERAYSAHRADGGPQDPGSAPPAGGRLVRAQRGGFVRDVDVEQLLQVAEGRGLAVQLYCQPGDDVVRGTPIARVWSGRSADPDQAEPDQTKLDQTKLDEAVSAVLDIGFERTSDRDAALGLRRLTDIAVKAISPAINDPVTASNSLSHCTDLLLRLQGKHLGPRVISRPAGDATVFLPGRDLRYFLDLVAGPVRRYGRGEPLVLMALLQLLRDCAQAARDDGQRQDIALQVDLVVDEVADHLLDYDKKNVFALAENARQALAGDVAAAYVDRAGEARST